MQRQIHHFAYAALGVLGRISRMLFCTAERMMARLSSFISKISVSPLRPE